MARILIAGCGDVGSALGVLLNDKGHRVWGLRRHPEQLPPEVEFLAGDLTDPGTLHQLPGGINVLYYTAAATDFNDSAYRAVYVDGVSNILTALERTNLERVVFVSSTGVYAQNDGGWVDEASSVEPLSFSGRRMLEGEAVARKSAVATIAVRFAGIYGPGRNRLLEQVRKGVNCCEIPAQWSNRIHRDDCAGVLAHLLSVDSPAPVYIGVDHEPAEVCRVMDWLAEQMQVPPPKRANEPGYMRSSSKRCSNRLLLASGYRFKYRNFRQGYREILNAEA